MLLETIWADARQGARGLLRSPGFAAAASLTLALGIGAASAMFAIVDAVLLEPLPYTRPESRVMLWSRWKGFDKTWVSEAEVLDYRRHCPSLAQVAAWGRGQANLTGDGEPLRIGIAAITPNTFATLGAAPLLGRGFTEAEALEGADAVAVLGYSLWQRRYGGDHDVVERTLSLDGVPRHIVGVMPPGFQLPTDFGADEPAELWVPLALDEEEPSRGSHGLYAAAELRLGATPARATAELETLTANLTREGHYPEEMRFEAFAVAVEDEILGRVRTAVWLIFGAVGFLLAIACANVANLQLARSETRQREIAVRAALGAGPGRLARQLLVEGLVLALPSGALGLALARGALAVLRYTGLGGIPRLSTIAVDTPVLAFTLVTTVATTVLFAMAPAVRSVRLQLASGLREGGHGATTSRGQKRLRGGLVALEMGLSVVLLVGAGMMLRGLWALQRVDLGFEPEGVLTLRLSLPSSGYESPERVHGFQRALLEPVRALPGVSSAGLVRSLPLASQIGDWGVDVEGFVESPGNRAKGDWQVVSDGALEALGIELAAGRSFTARDTADARQVVLVNQTMARMYWPGGDALGGHLRMGSEERPWAVVVGIVRDLRHNGIQAPIKQKFYRPSEQFHLSTGFAVRGMNLVVRTLGDPVAVAAPIRELVRKLDPNLPLAAVRPMTQVVAKALATQRLAGSVLGAFAIVAIVLSAVGIYGVLAYLVSRETREIGVRMAIGASARQVLVLFLSRGLVVGALGVAAGTVVALALAPVLGRAVDHVRVSDPLTFVLVPSMMLLVCAGASLVPALRATRVEASRALRRE